ncbi:MAG: hypothetical protein DRO15_00565 [Thermoprotei archaeon]|nr:MAG: hypothetical protein DRO15_00565 [Thermoprotei archaeon]
MRSEVHKLCPKLLVTVRTGKDSRGIEEIADALFPYDPQVKVATTRFKGVLLVYTNLTPHDAFRILNMTPPSVAERIVRVDTCVKTDLETISNAVLKLLPNYSFETFYVDCIRRGRYVKSSHEVEKCVGAMIVSKLGKRVCISCADIAVKIEIIDDLTLISIMKPEEDRIFKKRIPRV